MSSRMEKQRPKSAAGRAQRAYIDIPPSPLHSSRVNANVFPPSTDSRKENTPMRPRMESASSAASSNDFSPRPAKRKLSDASRVRSGREELLTTNSKKSRMSAPETGTSEKMKIAHKDQARKPEIAVDSELPDAKVGDLRGVFYCHQCTKKRDLFDAVHCTFINQSAKGKIHPCKAKYCRACLKNRYTESLEDIKAHDLGSLSKKEKEQHTACHGYYYRCPRCQGVCNCKNCRRAKGLPAMGRMVVELPMKASSSTASRVAPTTKDKSKTTDAESKASASTAAKARGATKFLPKPKPVPAPKPLPKPTWTRVHTALDYNGVDMRIRIREFVLRFSSVLNVGKTYQDELEDIGTTGLPDQDDGELVEWVSEACAKAVIVGLLSAIAEDNTHRVISKVTKDTVKEIRAAGANLTKIWSSLATLRDGLRSVPVSPFRYPDPLPLPSNVVIRSTRSGIQGKADSGVYVAMSSQLVPSILSLVESALETRPIRDEIDQGAIQEKELTRQLREAQTQANEKWKEQKAQKKAKAKASAQALRERHKQTLLDLELAHLVASTGCIPRYAPLGQDHEGRIYYMLTPGEAEREAAVQLLAGKDGKVKLGRRHGAFTDDKRQDMTRWSWFVAVWGRLPEGAMVAKAEGGNDNPDLLGDNNAECWWGFWQPEEVMEIAEWIAIKCALGEGKGKMTPSSEDDGGIDRIVRGRSSALDLESVASGLAGSREPSPLSDLSGDEASDDDGGDEDDTRRLYEGMRVDSAGKPVPGKRQLRQLVHGLKETARLLEWRVRRVSEDDKESDPTDVILRPVSAKKFYA